MGVEMRPRGSSQPERLAHDEFDRTRFLYERCELTATEIGALIGRSESTVRYRLGRAGAEVRIGSESMRLRTARRGERINRERVVEMWTRGNTLSEIADEFGTTAGYAKCLVGRMRRQGYNLPKRNRGKEEIPRPTNAACVRAKSE